jgi:ribonuclease BN (tRNA processing enzyme)
VRVQFVGTGTPLGQGGRLQACILLVTDDARILLDCGMTSLVGLARAAVEPRSLDAIVISHLHGDHFGGLPLLLLEAALREDNNSRGPLRIAGPVGIGGHVDRALQVFGWEGARVYVNQPGNVEFVTLLDREPVTLAGFDVTAFSVPHSPATMPSALRVSCGGKSIGYSGDAGWTDALREVANGVDLFICGVWSFDALDPTFLDYKTLLAQRDRLACARLILTHLGPTMLDHLPDLENDGMEIAEDGFTLTL